MPITSSDIIQALASKHSKDIFIPECSLTFGGGLRLDALVIKRSTSNSYVIGYEIKISRNDFIRDQKWPSYLSYCNEFYFVCPKNIISVDETPDDAGLYHTSGVGNKLYIKKKAKYRNIQIPEELWRSIIFNRTTIRAEYAKPNSQLEFWKNWLETKDEEKEIGYKVSQKLREIVKERIEKVESENRQLKSKIEDYESIKSLIQKMGHDPDSFQNWKVKQHIENICGLIPESMDYSLKSLKRSLDEFEKELKALKGGNNDT
jgi:hypothetical protein